MKKLYIIFLLALFANESLFAQDPQFTQFYANPLYLNPAMAGSRKCPRLALNYRNQWPGISGTFVTYSASYDQHIDALQGGVGVLVMADDQGGGTIKTTSFSGMYSYLLNVNRNFSMKFGMQATYFQKSLDWTKLNFGDQIDPRYGFIYQTNEPQGGNAVARPDFAAGMMGYTRNFFFGFAAHHLTQPEESLAADRSPDARLPRKYTGHVGAIIPFNQREPKEGAVSPNLLYQRQKDFEQLNIGLYVNKGPVVGGLWYRNKDSFIALVGIQTDVFKMGYSYDITVSKLTNATAGSHEISFALNFDCRPKRRRFREVSCPSF